MLLVSEKLEKYGRTLGRPLLRHGRDVSEELLKAGLAKPGHERRDARPRGHVRDAHRDPGSKRTGRHTRGIQAQPPISCAVDAGGNSSSGSGPFP